ncbi:hypothetical protein DSO57_1010893 [Entomophthora muscae]|uniref:Uncharacterized protein n=1 Tax=Entomophthora muscae TaxID=34485 RepID=A0ACC2T6L9_9FUNG|nr:hypothetical protein DSO57_1010893 [Entomophthora muscae]
MEYTAPTIPSIIPKEPDCDKLKEPAKTAAKTAKTVKEPAEDPAKNAAQTEESPGYFALSKDFEEDPVHQLVANNLYAIPACGRGRPRPPIGSQQPVRYTCLWKRKTPEDDCQHSRSSVQTLCRASARNLFEQ